MAVPVSEVPLWLILRGVGHAVAEGSPGGWCWTACRKLASGGEATAAVPRRKCRACIERLAVARVVPRAAAKGGG